MPDFSASFQRLFNSANFQQGGPRVLTLKSITRENVAREDEDAVFKPVAKFEEDERGYAFNKTNYDFCADEFGSANTDNWVGKKVELFFDGSVKRPGGGKGGIGFRSPSVK